MYRCACCGLLFDTTDRIRNDLAPGGYEDVCPRCKADMNQIEDVFQCDECGSYVTFDELITSDRGAVCQECFYERRCVS